MYTYMFLLKNSPENSEPPLVFNFSMHVYNLDMSATYWSFLIPMYKLKKFGRCKCSGCYEVLKIIRSVSPVDKMGRCTTTFESVQIERFQCVMGFYKYK